MNGDSFRKWLNRILTVFSILMTAIWLWKFFGPGSGPTRRAAFTAARAGGLDVMRLFWLSVAVVCAGYLLWRFLCWLFWGKYFKDE